MNQKMIKKHLPLVELWNALGGNIDVFIGCGSFEERCKKAAIALDSKVIKHAIIAENMNLEVYVSKNSQYLMDLFGDRAIKAQINSGKPLETADSLDKALSAIQSKGIQRYLVDITTFTHESLLMLVRLLSLRLRPTDRVFFVYTSAAEYSVGDTDDRKWLSKGIADIRSVLGYPGEYMPSRPTHLIVLVGYEHERAASLIEVFEPDRISLGHGTPGTALDPKHQRANELFLSLLKTTAGLYGERIGEFTFSCDDPWDARDKILECMASSIGYNIVVAPMNTKISTIGTALAAMKNESARLCYVQTLLYNFENYSSAATSCHLFEIPELLKKN